MTDLLPQAEALEATAALERVQYYSKLLGRAAAGSGTLLDVGCGNGYAVREWRARGLRAFGIDVSLYRLGRWTAEHPNARPFAVADASALPFRDRAFGAVVSSGMIEHVGVTETSSPYTVAAHGDQSEKRRAVVAELIRVSDDSAPVMIDFPNGSFPVDFWHGDRIGTFRLHKIPDELLPSFGDLRRWSGQCRAEAVLKPVSGRLRFRQVGRRWWGRLGKPAMRLFLHLLDLASRLGLARVAAPLYPYLVIQVVAQVRPAGAGSPQIPSSSTPRPSARRLT